MVNKYVEDFFARLFSERYARYWYWKEEITQIMWTALYEARDRYRRYAGAYELEKYAEKVIVYHVNRWISDNKHHQLACFSLNQKIVDNTSEMIELLVYDEPFEYNRNVSLKRFNSMNLSDYALGPSEHRECLLIKQRNN